MTGEEFKNFMESIPGIKFDKNHTLVSKDLTHVPCEYSYVILEASWNFKWTLKITSYYSREKDKDFKIHFTISERYRTTTHNLDTVNISDITKLDLTNLIYKHIKEHDISNKCEIKSWRRNILLEELENT